MGKNKIHQQNNKIKSDAKKDIELNKIKHKYENGSLSKLELNKLKHDKINEYLQKELSKKYNNDVKFHCVTCATTLLFDDGAITDDELLNTTNANKL
jgi:hypothetical protein